MPFRHLTKELNTFFKPTHQGNTKIIIGFVGDMIVTLTNSDLPHAKHFEALGKPIHSYDIGIIEHTTITLYVWDKSHPLPQSLIKTNLRAIINTYPTNVIQTLSRAKQLTHWLLDNVYCGLCGDTMHFSKENASLTCKGCGHLVFPRLSPACIVLVTKGKEILLARSPHFVHGIYSLLAGFVEAGESAETCAKREVKEEVGITIKNLRYFGTQSWSFPHSFMIGFFAEYESGELCLQEEEIEDAQWFTKETMPLLPYSQSIAYEMIQVWLETQNKMEPHK